MKQTAVEWIISKLPMVNDNGPYLVELIEQAKEMEKQQIIKFTNDFIDKHTYGDYDGNVQKNKTIEEYYNKTLKK